MAKNIVTQTVRPGRRAKQERRERVLARWKGWVESDSAFAESATFKQTFINLKANLGVD